MRDRGEQGHLDDYCDLVVERNYWSERSWEAAHWGAQADVVVCVSAVLALKITSDRRFRWSEALRALGGTRTPNLLIRSQMLYPLSYERKPYRPSLSVPGSTRWLETGC
jgi:hypothetical protein